MNREFYLSRKVYCDDKKFTESELLVSSKSIIILAEPGAGKTEFLKSLARQLRVKEVTANVFCYTESHTTGLPLVIDAFDELARIDQAGINKLLASALKTKPTQIIISSRSSEWDSSATNLFEQFFGSKPKTVRLCEFDEYEQEKIFENHTKRRDFRAFQCEVSRFSLEPILPNPQFLKLFADAYIESNCHFPDRRSIFSKAVDHLTRESNETAKPTPNLSVAHKVLWSSEVFTKLLLSGAEGVAKSEVYENRSFPMLSSLIGNTHADVSVILATKLFKPDSNPDLHLPVHKIVAEYCSAKYLINRIIDPLDDLTIELCLTVIAPNGCVRDELRGLLGWMAALGTKQIQEYIIELDAYAVLANGDPSQLDSTSKRLLLSKLKEVEANDPYFRRGDINRRFSVAGFFTHDVREEIKPILADNSDSELRYLLLELLIDSNTSQCLEKEIREIVTSKSERKSTRVLANKCLLTIKSYDYLLDFETLVSEASSDSLIVASDVIVNFGPAVFDISKLENFFRACTSLYKNGKRGFDNKAIGRYFIKRTISILNLSITEQLLNALSEGISCTCGKKNYECSCITGISKIIGSLLDHYFKLAKSPFNSLVIWQWIKNLNFPDQRNAAEILSVKVLKKDRVLREEIIAYYFGGLIEHEEVSEAKLIRYGDRCSHAGLRLNTEDYRFIVDLAFNKTNTIIWKSFLPYHWSFGEVSRVPYGLRTHMRKQANEKPEFMRVWANVNRRRAIQVKKDLNMDKKFRREIKRRENKKLQINAENHRYMQENRELVESGRHWKCLTQFAYQVLEKPEGIIIKFGDEKLVRDALRNCHEFIEPHIPNLQKLAELQCTSQGLDVETILFASCLEILRKFGNLEDVKHKLLFALRTNLSMGYSAVDEDEKKSLMTEVDRLIFPDTNKAVQFLREYLEPQLLNQECSNAEVELLKYDHVFAPLRSTLSIEWLTKLNELNYSSLTSLFSIAVQYANGEEVAKIVNVRCSQFLSPSVQLTSDKDFDEKRKFWFLSAFYFLSLDEAQPYWNEIKADKNTIFMFIRHSSRWNRGDYANWPSLNSAKIEAILNAFFIRWPKVELPNHYGTESPKDENAYRFLTEVSWLIASDTPTEAIPVLKRLLSTSCFSDIQRDLKSIQADVLKKHVLNSYTPPAPQEIKSLLDSNAVISVEGLRNLVLQELISYQKDIYGGEFNSGNLFYSMSTEGVYKRLGEVASVQIIADRLRLVVQPKGISIVAEHQTKNQNRIDITATKMIDGKKRLLVIEAKGQWHKDLYTAASNQLYERYSIHPDAEYQGIYLVIWFGADEKVTNKINHGITNAIELKDSLELTLPSELKGLIDIFVLDVSRCKE
jgi:hypothetical protein